MRACELVRIYNDIAKFLLRMGQCKLYVVTRYHYFTVFRTQDSLLHQEDSLWTPVSLWNFEVSQSTFGNLNQQCSIIQSYKCNKAMS